MNTNRTFAIVGGGIRGLTPAVALKENVFYDVLNIPVKFIDGISV